MGARLSVIIREPSKPERPLRLEGDTVRLGRADTNDIVLTDPRVSRHHACLERTDDGFTFENLTKGNPVFLNGTQAAAGEIAPGDVLQLGDTHVLLAETAEGDALTEAVRPRAADENVPLTETVVVPGIERARLELLTEIVNVLPAEEDRASFLDRV
ncbi:MAG: FHA domain-containing protein, partial [Planctomycetota bacterium]